MSTITIPPRRWLAICLPFMLLMLTPSGADAGTYDVAACDAAGGLNNSWMPTTNAPGVVDAYALCPSGGDPSRGLIARSVVASGSAASQGALARLTFTAPYGTAIVGIRASTEFTRSSSHWEAALSSGAQILRGCFPGLAEVCSTSAVDQWTDVPASTQLHVEAYCAISDCDLGSTSANARLYSAVVRVQDDLSPTIDAPGGALWADGWVGGTQTVQFDAADNTGIRSNAVFIDGKPAGENAHTCDYTYAVPCPSGGDSFAVNTRGVSDGSHQLQLRTTDAAGNPAQIERTIKVDNAPPGAPQQLSVDGGENWRATDTATVHWTNPTGDNGAPITGANWQLCPESGRDNCATGSRAAAAISSLPDVKIPRAGEWTLRVWLTDAAGNADIRTAAPAVTVRYDNDAPTATFAAFDPTDPTRLTVNTSDPTSGTGSGSIEIKRRAATAWTPLPTQVQPGSVVATLPDETLRAGAYELRATVRDQAGNERSTSTRPDGEAAQITLPVRSPTYLTAGRPRAHSSKLQTRVAIKYGARTRLRGRLLDRQHHAMTGVPLTVMTRTTLKGAAWRTAGTIHTTKTGRFSYRVRPGASRKVRVRYDGTPTVRASHFDVSLRVAGTTSFKASRHRLRNGQRVRFSGTVKGRVPTGKLVQLQTQVRGRWQTFATAHADRRARWSHSYRFTGSTRGRYLYTFRALVPAERGYPYSTGHSTSARVVVTGP